MEIYRIEQTIKDIETKVDKLNENLIRSIKVSTNYYLSIIEVLFRLEKLIKSE